MKFQFLVALTLSVFAVAPTWAQSEPDAVPREPVLRVVGRGVYQARPDLVHLVATVTTEAKTLQDVTKAHETRATKAFDLIVSMKDTGLEVERSTFHVSEKRAQKVPPVGSPRWITPKSVVEGYTAETTFRLKQTKLSSLNDMISRLAEADLFTIGSVRFEVREERSALNQARRAAMLDALEQAKAYTEPVSLKIGRIVSITDGEATPPEGYADMPARRPSERYSVQIVPPSEVERSASVTVTWRIGE
jgi:uncharacterized protein YggE